MLTNPIAISIFGGSVIAGIVFLFGCYFVFWAGVQ